MISFRGFLWRGFICLLAALLWGLAVWMFR